MALKVPTKPAGKSFFTDLASAGAGFATGLAKERDKRKQEQIDQAMRDFSQQMQVEQLGTQQNQLKLQEQSLISQNNAQASAEADRLLGRQIQQRELAALEARTKAQAEADRLDREFKEKELKAKIAVEYAKIASDERIGNFTSVDSGNRSQVNHFNSLVDNYKGQLSEYIKNHPELYTVLSEPTNTLAKLKANVEKYAPKNPNDTPRPEYNTAVDKLQAAEKLLDIERRKQAALDDMDKAVRQGRDFRTKVGLPDTTTATIEPRWSSFSDEEKATTKAALAEFFAKKSANNEEVNVDKWLDIGVPPEVLEEAKNAAGAAVNAPLATIPAPRVPDGSGSLGGIRLGQKVGSMLNPQAAPGSAAPPTDGTAPSYVPPKSLKQVPSQAPQQRAPIMQGPVQQLSPTFQPKPFAFDTAKHRVLRPAPGL